MVIYGSNRDYRNAMQNKYGADRAHAICRKLVGVSQSSKWYGAHYRAACALLHNPEWDTTSESRQHGWNGLLDRLDRWADSFAQEVDSSSNFDFGKLSKGYQALWRLAVNRVYRVMREAEGLRTSVDW